MAVLLYLLLVTEDLMIRNLYKNNPSVAFKDSLI